MFLSIITPTFNSQKYLAKCLNSVFDQNFENYEQLIIDNFSSDRTISIAKKIGNSRIKIVSEIDNGIYDAMNKGINYSNGQYLLFLNSDDEIIDKNFLTNTYNILKNKEIDILYSNIEYEKNKFQIIRKYISGNEENLN